MSQVLSSARPQMTSAPHIAGVVPTIDGRLAPRTHTIPTVFVVDDDSSVRESLKLLITFAGWRPETFASAEEFLARPRVPTASCLVSEVSLPDLNGLELQERVATRDVEMPVIFITGHGDVPITVRAMKAGAVEFLTKPYDDEVLLGAIRNAIDQSEATLRENAEIQVLRARYAALTFREREVMALVILGLLNKQIALKLEISESTVKAHRGKVMQKMEADSVVDLVKAAERLHLQLPQKSESVLDRVSITTR